MLEPWILAEAVESIVKAGIEAAPLEACGLICPDGTIYFLTNESEKQQEYYVSNSQLAAAIYNPDGVESLGYEFGDVVLWHTHPSDTPSPSPGDIESRKRDQLKDITHLVVAIPSGQATYF